MDQTRNQPGYYQGKTIFNMQNSLKYSCLSTDLKSYPEIRIKVMQKPLNYGILSLTNKKIVKELLHV